MMNRRQFGLLSLAAPLAPTPSKPAFGPKPGELWIVVASPIELQMTPRRIVWGEGLPDINGDDLREQVDLSLVDPDFSIITNYEVHWVLPALYREYSNAWGQEGRNATFINIAYPSWALAKFEWGCPVVTHSPARALQVKDLAEFVTPLTDILIPGIIHLLKPRVRTSAYLEGLAQNIHDLKDFAMDKGVAILAIFQRPLNGHLIPALSVADRLVLY